MNDKELEFLQEIFPFATIDKTKTLQESFDYLVTIYDNTLINTTDSGVGIGGSAAATGTATADHTSATGTATADHTSATGTATADHTSATGTATADHTSATGTATADHTSATGTATADHTSATDGMTDTHNAINSTDNTGWTPDDVEIDLEELQSLTIEYPTIPENKLLDYYLLYGPNTRSYLHSTTFTQSTPTPGSTLGTLDTLGTQSPKSILGPLTTSDDAKETISINFKPSKGKLKPQDLPILYEMFPTVSHTSIQNISLSMSLNDSIDYISTFLQKLHCREAESRLDLLNKEKIEVDRQLGQLVEMFPFVNVKQLKGKLLQSGFDECVDYYISNAWNKSLDTVDGKVGFGSSIGSSMLPNYQSTGTDDDSADSIKRVHPDDIEEYRQNALYHHKKSTELYSKAISNFKKSPSISSYYSTLAREQRRQMDYFNSLASKAIISNNRLRMHGQKVVDLHGLYVSEASQYLTTFLNSEKESVKVICGLGRGKRVGVLVKEMWGVAKRCGWRCFMPDDGSLGWFICKPPR